MPDCTNLDAEVYRRIKEGRKSRMRVFSNTELQLAKDEEREEQIQIIHDAIIRVINTLTSDEPKFAEHLTKFQLFLDENGNIK